MQTIKMSATKARNQFFDVLAWVSMGKTVLIEKDNKLVANIVPIAKVSKNKGLLKALKKASAGFVYDKNDDPLRRKGATDFLGKF